MPASSTLTFLNPFEGPAVPLRLSGVLTFSPEEHLKLNGTPLSAVFAEHGMLPWYRRGLRLQESTALNRGRRAQKLIDEMATLCPGIFAVFPDIERARNGNESAQERLNQVTDFELFNRGRGLRHADLKPHQAYLEEVGAADLELVRQLKAGDMAAVLAHMGAHPVLQYLLWPAAEAVIGQASTPGELIPLFGAMALDVHLGWMAAWDVDHAREHGGLSSSLSCLLPNAHQPGRNPTSLFFDELKLRLGVRSAAQVLKGVPTRDSGLDQATLDRWSAGTRLPDKSTLQVILHAYRLDQPSELLYAQLGCSRHLHMLGHLASRLQTRAREASQPRQFWPWPAYAFEFPDFESWTANRYPFWLDFHRKRTEDGTASRTAPAER